MDWPQQKTTILNNIEEILVNKKLSKNKLNIYVFGITPKKKAKGTLWRSDQKKWTIPVIIKVADFLEVSIDIIIGAARIHPHASREWTNLNNEGDLIVQLKEDHGKLWEEVEKLKTAVHGTEIKKNDVKTGLVL